MILDILNGRDNNIFNDCSPLLNDSSLIVIKSATTYFANTQHWAQ